MPSGRKPLPNGRKEAKTKGEPTYQGQPCQKCNGTTRRTYDKRCIDCRKEKKVKAPHPLKPYIPLKTKNIDKAMACVAYGNGNTYPDKPPYNNTHMPKRVSAANYLRQKNLNEW